MRAGTRIGPTYSGTCSTRAMPISPAAPALPASPASPRGWNISPPTVLFYRPDSQPARRAICLLRTLILRREVVAKVGCFDTTLTMCEDRDFTTRARKLGFRLRYEPKARVTHYPAIHGLSDYLGKMRHYGTGTSQYFRRWQRGRTHWRACSPPVPRCACCCCPRSPPPARHIWWRAICRNVPTRCRSARCFSSDKSAGNGADLKPCKWSGELAEPQSSRSRPQADPALRAGSDQSVRPFRRQRRPRILREAAAAIRWCSTRARAKPNTGPTSRAPAIDTAPSIWASAKATGTTARSMPGHAWKRCPSRRTRSTAC